MVKNNFLHALAAALIFLLSTCSYAAIPSQIELGGLKIGSSAREVKDWAKKILPECEVTVSNYMPDETGNSPEGVIEVGAYLDITATEKNCYRAQATKGKADEWKVELVHASIDDKSPAYSITLNRAIIYSSSFDKKLTVREVVDSLIKTFGTPTFHGATNLQRSFLKIELDSYKRTKFVKPRRQITVWWGERWDDRFQSVCIENCGKYNLRAEITSEYQSAKMPSDEIVTGMSLELEDTELKSIHFDWRLKFNKDREAQKVKF